MPNTTPPTPDMLRKARARAGLTQLQAAELVHRKMRTWQDWEAGITPIPLGLWELFLLRTQNSS